MKRLKHIILISKRANSGPTQGMNSHFDPDDEVPLDVDLDPPFMENTPFPLRVAVTVTRGRFNGITARGGAGTRLW